MASSPNAQSKLLERHTEIKDQDELVERAKNNVSDLPIGNQLTEETVYSQDNESTLYVTKYKTAQFTFLMFMIVTDSYIGCWITLMEDGGYMPRVSL
ncbi:hypothetical protein BK133_14845 [Paenibacillus sp. FSL H8-0548]|nr:hypothetical protein BK133_14845 [Paenibacillus sp. FSL H8-0548]